MATRDRENANRETPMNPDTGDGEPVNDHPTASRPAGSPAGTPSSGEPDAKRERSPWVVAGVFGALGFEFVGFTLAGVLLGHWLDQRWGTDPFGLLAGVALALVAVFWHIVHVLRRFIASEEDSEDR